jgi:hypothetical protein
MKSTTKKILIVDHSWFQHSGARTASARNSTIFCRFSGSVNYVSPKPISSCQLQAGSHTTLGRNGRNRQSVQNESVVETPAHCKRCRLSRINPHLSAFNRWVESCPHPAGKSRRRFFKIVVDTTPARVTNGRGSGRSHNTDCTYPYREPYDTTLFVDCFVSS